MPANFWFEIRGTETYKRFPRTTKEQRRAGALSTDWDNPVPATREEFEQKGPNDSIYQYRDNEELQRVDELICEFMGESKPQRACDSDFFFWCHEVAFQTLYTLGGSYIGDKPEHIPELHKRMDTWIARVRKDHPDNPVAKQMEQEGYRARCHALIDWVFVTKWEYHATG